MVSSLQQKVLMRSSTLTNTLALCMLFLVAACGGSTNAGGGGKGPCDESGSCGPFACGSMTCDGATQYCLDSYTEGMSDDVYTCEPLPAACKDQQTCACVEAETGHSCPGAPGCTEGAVSTCAVVP